MVKWAIIDDPYLAFFQQDWTQDGQDVGDSEVTYFHEPVEEIGGTLVRFYMPASRPNCTRSDIEIL